MMKLRLLTILMAVCAVVAFGSLADVATAEFMTVNNHSFEAPVVAEYEYVLPTDWSGDCAYSGPNDFAGGFPTPSTGRTGDQCLVAWGLWRDGFLPNIYQDLGSIGGVASYVTLMVDVAARPDDPNHGPAPYTVQLENAASGEVLASSSTPPPPMTAWATSSTDTVLVPAGTSIRVRLFINEGDADYGPHTKQTFMDNIRVESNPIPEPSTLVLTVFGLIGLAAFIRRRK